MQGGGWSRGSEMGGREEKGKGGRKEGMRMERGDRKKEKVAGSRLPKQEQGAAAEN